MIMEIKIKTISEMNLCSQLKKIQKKNNQMNLLKNKLKKGLEMDRRKEENWVEEEKKKDWNKLKKEEWKKDTTQWSKQEG